MKELSKYLEAVYQLVERNRLTNDKPIIRFNDPAKVRALLNSDFPISPQSFEQVLDDFEQELLPSFNHNTSTNFAAYITGSGNPIGAVAEFIKAYYNQNGLKWNNSPIASELEQLVIRWIADFCLLDAHQKGVLTSGGSMSNLLAIHFALAKRYPNREMEGMLGAPKLTIYCSNQTHSSFERGMVFLGLGRNLLRKIDVNREFQIDLDLLEMQIQKDVHGGFTPFMIVGNAGTTNTGSIDDLNALASIAERHKMWFHGDGAYGLPARRLPDIKEQFDGIEKADSVTINPHKWMYVPFEASCILLKEIPQAIHFSPDYLFTENPGERWESSNHTIELTKELRALKIWFTMKYYGANQLAEFIAHDIEMTNYFCERLSLLKHICIEPNHPLSIVCFRYENPELSDSENEKINIRVIRQIESDGKVFITGTKLYSKTHLRTFFGHPDRTVNDVDYMVGVIEGVVNDQAKG